MLEDLFELIKKRINIIRSYCEQNKDKIENINPI